ncbi:MAG: hypothetical protein IJ301_05455 [Clostridia bacterium]|nr:hypothetical protein [Clostridia bacterium]
MQQFVFPAVLYKDAENRGYTIVLHDLNICTEGTTVEDAFLRAKDFLEAYCKCALEYNGEVEEATKYVDVSTDAQNIVLLVDAVVDEEKDGVLSSKRFSFDI